MAAPTATKFLKVSALLVAVTGLLPAHADAQDATPGDNTGFRAQQAFISYQPWESINPYGGNVIWHFTDFVLPGNAGMNVAWTRTFNSGNAAGGWRFGVAGVPIRVEEPGNDALPVVFTADGGASGTDLVDENDENIVIAHALLAIYDRTTHVMKLPNGWIVTFGDVNAQGNARFPTQVSDAFGNSLTFAYDAPLQTYTTSPRRLTSVHQSGPHGVDRTVAIAYDGYDRVATVTANGRTWTYTYADTTNATWFVAKLANVQLPDATSWQYGDSISGSTRTLTATTPIGGLVTYTVVQHTMADASTKWVLTERTTGGKAVITDRIPAGTWTYSYTNHAGDDAFGTSTVVVPGGTRSVTYNFIAPDGSSTRGKPIDISIYNSNNAQVQQEHFVYGDVPQDNAPSEVGLLRDHSVTRDGRTCNEHYDYSPGDHADFHNPWKTYQSGCGAERLIERWFKNEFAGTYRKVVLTDEWFEIPGERITTRHYDFSQQTGFMTAQMIGGVTTTFAASVGGNVETATTEGRHVSYEYDKGIVSAVRYPNVPDLDVTRVINTDGTVARQQRQTATGLAETFFDYDAAGQLWRIRPPLLEPTIIQYEGWSPTGDSRVVTTTGGYASTTRVNGLGQAYATIDTFGIEAWTKFDAEGRVVQQSFPYIGSPTGTERVFYDTLGRVTARQHSDDSSVQIAYGNDGSGNGTVAITDERNNTTTQVWAGFGSPDDAQLIRVTDATNHTWTYQYGATGKLTLVTAPDNTQRSWIYTGHTTHPFFDGFLLRAQTQPESGTTSYSYNADGSLASQVDANGTTTAYEYWPDDAGRLWHVNAGGRVTTLSYAFGNLTSVAAPDATTEYTYDRIGNLLSRQDTVDGFPFTSTFAYEYAHGNALKDVNYPSGRQVRYTTDAAGRTTSVFDQQTNVVYASGFEYAPTGALKQYTTGNGLVHTMAYDPQRLWLTDITVTQGSTDLLHFAYDQHDNAGNITRITDPRAGMTQTFGYDALNRLHTASGSYGSIQYDYNAHGDRVTNGYGSYTYDASTLRLTGQNSDTFSYDNIGNLRFYNADEFQYFPEGAMQRSVVAGATTDYRYAGDGWRVKKASGSNVTYYFRGAGGPVLTEWANPTASPTVPRDFIYAGGKLIAAVRRTLDVADGSPVTFTFTNVTNAATSALTYSNVVAITGIVGTVATSIAGGGAEYQICSDAACASGSTFTSGSSTITNGQYVRLRLTSSSAFLTASSTTVSVGTGSAGWSVTTGSPPPPDTTPDSFSFTDQNGLAKNQVASSNVVHITGINAPAAIAIVGGAGAYRVCGDASCSAQPAFTTVASSVVNGQYVQLQQPAANAYATNASTTLSVGTAAEGWTVSTTNDFPRMGGDWYTLNALCCWIGAAANEEVDAVGWGGGSWAAHQDGFLIYIDNGSGVVGELTPDGQELYWSDGSVWARQPYEPQLQDAWYSPQYDVWCWIDINGNGTAGDVWDEWGNRVFVRQTGTFIEILWSSDYGVYDSGAIYWSDGRVWVR